MKKKTISKISLKKSTLSNLSVNNAKAILGGGTRYCGSAGGYCSALGECGSDICGGTFTCAFGCHGHPVHHL
jgi:natural product precursor